ncbi:Zinc finger homeobox protein 4 [Araneus ventricosus]|uniref:Zinc finger homeobox protein 4 n=1 Tax=Araneus ventricosus TaxID=182803 RepID=A0A4Y2GUX3_ARAVE|nr:Zinc finger homeobox protein 4 [Araneus ventricosus]
MDYRKTGITHEMVKMTIKRAADSPDNNKWVCKRIDDDQELQSTEETAHGPRESLPVDGENSNEEAEDSENWYHKIPSHLEIEMTEIDNRQPSWGSSAENNTNTLETRHPTHSHGTTDSVGNSCSDPMNLSRSYLKHKSRRDVTNNVSYRSLIGAHSSKSKYLENVYGDFRNTPSLTGPDGIIQGEAASHFSSAMWPQNTSLSPNERLMISGEVAAMAMRTMPSTNQKVSMTTHRNSLITSGLVNSEKPEIIAKGSIPNNLQQEAPRPLKKNYGHFSADARNYGHSSNAPNSDANRSYNWPLASESNANGPPIRNKCAERIGDNLVNNLSQQPTNYLKRLSQTGAQIGSNDALESVRPPKRKKSHAEVPGTTWHCNVCDVTFKTVKGYRGHALTEKHLMKVNQAYQQQSNLYNFQPNSVSRTFGPTVLETQPQPHPHLLYLMGNKMRYHQMYQAYAMAAANQSGGGRTVINNADVQNSHPGTSKSDCNEEFLGHNMSQNDLETKCHAQDQRYMNLPVNHTSNPQGILLLPGHPQSENSTMANPKYLENKAPQSIRCHKDSSSQIEPENSSVWRSMAKSDPRVIKSNQPENLTLAGSFQKSKDDQSVPHHQLEFFRVYHCLVCSMFHTDYLQELERHVSIDRSKPFFEMITVSGDDLCCKLCDFKTQICVEMRHHCASIIHLNRLDYYNHVMEGGSHSKEKLKNVHEFSPVFLFCSACEFATKSMDTLKAHSIDPSHQHNVSCCIYISRFSPAVEYCYCRSCSVRTLTKRELLLHVRSRHHKNKLRQYPSNDRKFHDPAHLFFIKELSLDISEAPRVSEQTEGRTFIEREKPHLIKENNEKNDFTENPAPLDLSSASSTSLKPLPVSCSLCQKILPEINVLEKHLQRIHGVNEAGVKWLISAFIKVHEEIQSTEELSNTKAGKPKSILFPPQKSSATDKTLPIQGMSIDSSSYQSSVAAEQNLESKSSTCRKAVTSEQNMAMGENLNQEEREDADFSSSQLLCKTEHMQNPDKLDRNPDGRTGKDFSSSQQFCETERMQNPGRSSTDSSLSQQFYEKEGMRNSGVPDQNLYSDQERVNIDPPSSKQFHKTENIPPVKEEIVSNSEENLYSSSSQAEVIEYESEPNRDSKYETQTDDSSSEHFSATEHGSPVPPSDHNASRERNDTSSSDHNSVTPERLLAIYDSSIGHTSPISQSGLNANRERSDSSSSDNNSVTPERLLAIYDSSIEHTSPISQSGLNASREWYDSSSSDHNSATLQRSPPIDDSASENFLAIEHESPKSQSGVKARRKRNGSSSDNIFVEYEWLPVREKRSRVNSSPSQHYLLDSKNEKSPLEDQQNFNLGGNVINDSPISRLMALVESTPGDDYNISVMNKNSGDSVNGEIVLYDCPNEYEAEFSAPNSPAAIDPQIQARKSIENIKISDVFSLVSRVENSSDTDEEEESLDFECIVFSDLEEL